MPASDQISICASPREAIIRAKSGRDAYAITDTEILRLYPEIEPTCREAGIELMSVDSSCIKSLNNLAHIWKFLSDKGATRQSLVINIGGGSVTDLGGFAAATFKRGIDYLNIPTTLLAAADASIGGKTGIDFNGLKNEVGAFRKPLSTIVVPEFLNTLPRRELLSGLGEIIKTGFLAGRESAQEALKAAESIGDENSSRQLAELARRSAEYKLRIVDIDPKEQGLRKILNLGHTAGHAFESFAAGRGKNVAHGCAIAQGLLTALILSHTILGLDAAWIYRLAETLRNTYTPIAFSCDDYPRLLSLMRHDKKNRGDGTVRFVLLRAPGEAEYDVATSEKDIECALDITRDYL